MVKSGLEVLRQKGYKPVRGQRIGLLTNPSAIDANFESAYDILCSDDRVNVTALFAPEHGFMGAVSEGEQIQTQRDPRTGLPIYSLYESETQKPNAEILAEIDAIVCDIQDIGVRYYTFMWTISHLLETAAQSGVTVVLLDRPNPLGGVTVYGPALNPELSSLVGRYPVPVIHGMTLAEALWMINETWSSTLARLSIIPCDGWRRDMRWKDTGLPWIPPSPNLPHLKTVHHYPGACLLEGTNLSEGRGTALPFEITGAPWIDGMKLAKHLNAQDWIDDCGVRFRPHTFQPIRSKWAGETCHGVQAHIVDPAQWNAIKAWLNVIATIRHLYPEQFTWHTAHFDRLIGSRTVRTAIDDGKPIRSLIPDWLVSAAQFTEERKPFLLYD